MILFLFCALFSETDRHNDVLGYLGLSEAFSLNDLEKAISEAEIALQKARENHDTRMVIKALIQLGIYNSRIEKFDIAEAYLDSALDQARKQEDIVNEGNALLALGSLYAKRGSYRPALDSFRDALERFEQSNVQYKILLTHIRIADLYIVRMEYEAAIRELQNVLFELEESEEKELVYEGYYLLGQAYKQRGMYRGGVRYLEKAIGVAQGERDSIRTARTLMEAGKCHIQLGQYDEALDKFIQAESIYNTHDLKPELAQAYNCISSVYQSLNKITEAIEFMEKAQNINVLNQDFEQAAENYITLGGIYLDLHHYDAAGTYLERALSIFKMNGNVEGMIRASLVMSSVYLAAGEYGQASRYATEALGYEKQLNSDRMKPRILLSLGNVSLVRKRYQETFDYLTRALEIAGKISARQDELEILYKLSMASEKLRRYRDALNYYKRYEGLKDSLFNEMSSLRVTEMQSMIETSEQQRENELLKAEKQRSDTELMLERQEREILEKNLHIEKINAENRGIWLLFSLVGTVVTISFVVLIFLRYRREKDLRSKIDQQKSKLEEAYAQLNAAQQEKIELERLKSAIALSVTMNHEINQPLMIMQGNLDMLLHSSDPFYVKKHQKYINNITESIRRVTGIMDRIENLDRVSYTHYAGASDMLDIHHEKPAPEAVVSDTPAVGTGVYDDDFSQSEEEFIATMLHRIQKAGEQESSKPAGELDKEQEKAVSGDGEKQNLTDDDMDDELDDAHLEMIEELLNKRKSDPET